MTARSMMLLALPVMLFACGDDDGGDAETPAEGGADGGAAVLVIEDFAFSEVTVEPGATVSVENRDGAPHTVTAIDDGFGLDQVDGGASGEFTAPAEAGEYAYFCAIHPDMEGTLVVS